MTDAVAEFRTHFDQCPLIAILRGVRPKEAEDTGDALVAAGVRIIEVPLNSPDPFESIDRLARRFGDQALIGAGTVIQPDDVAKVAAVGGRLIVSPGFDVAVVKATVAADMISAPGFFTPSEAFGALAAGAHVLKLFPAEAAPPAMVKAHRAVLPRSVPLVIVGGVTVQKIAGYRSAGADGFGLGGGLYRPGQTALEVSEQARPFVTALRKGI